MAAHTPQNTIQISDKRLARLDDKEYRHIFMREMVTGWVVHQLRVLREQRSLTQKELGSMCGKPQSTIGRLENLEYGKWNVSTLLELAEAFDVALEVRFIDWPTFLSDTEDLSVQKMEVESWNKSRFQRASVGLTLARNEVHLVDDDSKQRTDATSLFGPRPHYSFTRQSNIFQTAA